MSSPGRPSCLPLENYNRRANSNLGMSGQLVTPKSKDLKEGTKAILTVERGDDGKPVLRVIKLGGPGDGPGNFGVRPGKQGGKPVVGKDNNVDTSGLIPLTDMGDREYKGFKGGLYPDSKNVRPASHEAAGLALAQTIQPLGKDGKPSADGKIVLLGIGFSNTVQCFNGFMDVAKEDKDVNPKVLLINGAVGGRSASMISKPDEGKGKEYWATVDQRLKVADVTHAQVEVIWLKETNAYPHEGTFPKYTQDLESQLVTIVQYIHQQFPNVKMIYLSSRSFGGWARTIPPREAPGNSEPFSYETGFAVKWLIEQQLKGDPALTYDSSKGEVKAPWLSWGPYFWANGEIKRKDGFSFQRSDYTENDQMHHSKQGIQKMGKELLHFFKTDTTTRDWFVKKAS